MCVIYIYIYTHGCVYIYIYTYTYTSIIILRVLLTVPNASPDRSSRPFSRSLHRSSVVCPKVRGWRSTVEIVLLEISNSMKPYASVFHTFDIPVNSGPR